jgi:hypothetical protein
MIKLSVLGGSQMGAAEALVDGQSYLLGASDDNDLVLHDAGSARALLRPEGAHLAVTALSPGVAVNGAALDHGTSRVCELPLQLALGKLQLGIADGALKENSAGLAQTPPTRRRSRSAAWFVMCALLCSAMALYIDSAADAGDHDSSTRFRRERQELMVRWKDRGDAAVLWSEVSEQGHLRVTGTVADDATESRLRSEIGNSRLTAEISVVNLEKLNRELSAALRHPSGKLELALSEAGVLQLRVESAQWALAKRKVTSMRSLPSWVNRFHIVVSDVWVQGRDEPVVLHFDRNGPLDALSRTFDPDAIVLPSQLLEQLDSIRFFPQPTLVTRKRERIMTGAVLPNGVELLQIEPGSVTLGKNGLVRRQRLS